MIDVLINIIKESVNLWLAMSPYLLLGMLIAGILHVFLGPAFISRHLGGTGLSSIFKATLFGIPLPVCSCGVIPVAASLKKEGASKSSTLSFLVSTPTTGVDSIAATYSLMGPLFAVFRPIAAFFSGIIIGVFNHIFNPDKKRAKRKKHSHQVRLSYMNIKEIFRYGFMELAEDIGKWMLLGVMIGGILTAIIPQNLLLTVLPNPFLHFLVMLLIAVPLYVCAIGSIPIAAALIQKGFSPGAALIFLIAGPATNAVTLSFVRSKLGKKAFYIYLISIIIVSIVLGLVFNLIWMNLGGSMELISPYGEQLPLILRIVSGVGLLMLILVSFLKPKKQVINIQYEVTVPDMTCKHCKMTLENTLQKVKGVDKILIDLDKKSVSIEGEADPEQIKKAIKQAGYRVENNSKQEDT
ncbi:MAG: permease [bacterium]